jgi:subtilisin family serine protease
MSKILHKALLIGMLICLISAFSFAQAETPARVPVTALELPDQKSFNGGSVAGHEPDTLILQLYAEAETSANFQALSAGELESGLDSLDRLLLRYAVRRVLPARPSGENSPRLFKLEMGPGQDLLEAAALFSQDPHVELAEPNYIYHSTHIPNDPLFQEQWGLHNTGQASGGTPDADIDAPEAWDITQGDPDIIIAIIDTGVNWMHLDLASNIWINPGESPGNGKDDDQNGYIDDVRGWDFVTSTWVYPGEDGYPEDNDPDDFSGHGTHVAGIAAAVGDNGIGITGVCPKCTIMPLRAGFVAGDGGTLFYLFDLANAIYYAVNNGAHVINMSLGGIGMPLIMDQAIQFAYQEGVVIVAAAGNNNNDAILHPAAYPQVIAVAATNAYDQRAGYSTFGYDVDLAAPGSWILGTYPNSSYIRMSGTSMASPMVAGVAGLLLSQNPQLSPDQVRAILVSTADPKAFDQYVGSGRLNAHQALLMTGVPLAHIQWPAQLEFLTGTVPVSGIAGGSGFSHYILDYGAGYYPSQWHVLKQSGTPVINGTLALFNTSSLPNGTYMLRLRVTDQAGNTNLNLRPIYIEHDFLTGWPLEIGDAIIQAPLLADVNGDGQLEVLAVVKETGWVHIWRPDGASLPGWPVRAGHNLHGSAAAADLNGDGRMEIVISSEWNALEGFPRYINIYRYDGTRLPGWPVYVGLQSFLTPALGDLDGDGQMEIVVSTSFDAGTVPTAGVYVYKLDGTLMPGWPKSFPMSDNPDHPWTSGPVLGDLTGNGLFDVAAGVRGGSVFAWNDAGQVLPGWPKTMQPDNPPEQRGLPKLALGDLNKDGNLEVVAVNGISEVRVWNSNGQLLPGWPFEIIGSAFSPPALGDLTGDGDLEIVAQSNDGHVYAWRANGSLLTEWPVQLRVNPHHPPWDQPLIVDVNGDGQLDVVLASLEKAIIAIQGNGSFVPGWHKPMHEPGYHTPAIGDFTGDGLLELLAGTYRYFYVWKLNSPAGETAWSMFQANPQRTGRYPSADPPQLPDPTAPPPPSPAPTVQPNPGAGTEYNIYVPMLLSR